MPTFYGSWDIYTLNDTTAGDIASNTVIYSSTDDGGAAAPADGLENTSGDTDTATVGGTVEDSAFTLDFSFLGTVTITVGGGPVTGYVLDNGGSYYLAVPANTVAGGGALPSFDTSLDTSPGTWALCYCAGTKIATPSGERDVETLRAGDLVTTADGSVKPVRWVGSSQRSSVFGDLGRILPVRIKAGALGDSLPVRDLVVSPGHGVLIDNVLVNASALLNGSSVVRETALPPVFTYYHVELDSHDLLVAEGVATESFLVGVEDLNFDNLADRPAETEQHVEMALPRVKSARQLPASVRELLADRAAAIAPALSVAA